MECYHPQVIRLPSGEFQEVRCGKCLSCLSHRQAEWTTRLGIELKAHPDTCYFATLTYNDEYLPIKKVWSEPDQQSASLFSCISIPVVCKSDVQKFHMDLRKRFQQGFFQDDTLVKLGVRSKQERIALDPCKFSYYLTSEYGPEGHRPHYHAFYSGLPEDEYLVQCLFNSIWRKGFIQVERAESDKAAAYVAKYLVNTSLVPLAPGAVKPFALMSKGLGSSYLDNPRMMDYHRQDPVSRCYIPDGANKVVMSRYLRERIFDDDMKQSIYEDSVRRSERAAQQRERLSDKERQLADMDRRHREAEAVRQAEWRFRKNGKIK